MIRLRVIAGPDYWSVHAELQRRAWRMEDEAGEARVVEALRKRCARRGAIKRVAHELGVSRGTLGAVLRRERPAPPELLARLGLRRVTTTRIEKIG